MLEKADKAVRVSIRDHKDLDEWVAEDGPLILVGEAAHPFPVRPLLLARLPSDTDTRFPARHYTSYRDGR